MSILARTVTILTVEYFIKCNADALNGYGVMKILEQLLLTSKLLSFCIEIFRKTHRSYVNVLYLIIKTKHVAKHNVLHSNVLLCLKKVMVLVITALIF